MKVFFTNKQFYNYLSKHFGILNPKDSNKIINEINKPISKESRINAERLKNLAEEARLTNNLKSCECGGESVLFQCNNFTTARRDYYIQCSICKKKTEIFHFEWDVINAWNRIRLNKSIVSNADLV